MKRLKRIATDDVIDALRGAADEIRKDLNNEYLFGSTEPYNFIWSDPDRCICGHFVNHLLNEKVKDFPSAWCELFETERHVTCTESGITYAQIREALNERGFTDRTISHMENANDPLVLDHIWAEEMEATSPAHASEYLEAMASLLEELQQETSTFTHDREPTAAVA